MPTSVTLKDKQKTTLSVEIVDQDGQPFTNVPAGATVLWSSTDPEVAVLTGDPTGLSIDLGSGKVGTAEVDVAVAGLGTVPDFADTCAVAVENSDPAAVQIKVGVIVDE